MTKWLITHSSNRGVKWQVVSFNGSAGNEWRGIVDMIAIRKNHRPAENVPVGDLFEIILIQMKGGSAKFLSDSDIFRLEAVRKHHRADKVVITEWKKGVALRCYELQGSKIKTPVPASDIFRALPTQKQLAKVAAKEARDL